MSGVDKKMSHLTVSGQESMGQRHREISKSHEGLATASSIEEGEERWEMGARRKVSRGPSNKQTVTTRWLRKEKVLNASQSLSTWATLSVQFRLTSTKEIEIMITSGDKQHARMALEEIQESVDGDGGDITIVGLEFNAQALVNFLNKKFFVSPRGSPRGSPRLDRRSASSRSVEGLHPNAKTA